MIQGILDLGAKSFVKAKWTLLVEKIMAKRHTYSNNFLELKVPGTLGFVLSGVDPSKGHFGDTGALPKGIQLKEHHGKVRGQYNLMVQKLDKSGFHDASEELLRAQYDRTADGNKVKDMGLLFYFLTVKDHDLDFLSTVLEDDENGQENDSVGKSENETAYSKRKKSLVEKESKQRADADEKTIHRMRSVLAPRSPGGRNVVLDNSVVAKNNQSVITSEKNALYLVSLTATENTKSDIMLLEFLKTTLADPHKKNYLDSPDVAKMKLKFAALMKLD